MTTLPSGVYSAYQSAGYCRDLGYEVRSGELSDGMYAVAGTLTGVAPSWETLVVLEYADPLEFDTAQVIAEAVALVKITTN